MGSIFRRRSLWVAVVVLCGLAVYAQIKFGVGREFLWQVVHGECVPDWTGHGNPSPCDLVDVSGGVEGGYAVLRDIRGMDAYLLIPTARIPGIESPLLEQPAAPNYFADAWRERNFLDGARHRLLARDAVGLAINSVASRSQDQLHIHIACLRPAVRSALENAAPPAAGAWQPVSLLSRTYLVAWTSGAELQVNPFQMVAASSPAAAAHMGDRTIAVAGSTAAGAPGFWILQDSGAGEDAHAEDLLDLNCRMPPPAGR